MAASQDSSYTFSTAILTLPAIKEIPDSFHDELDFFPASAAKIALSCKISSQDTVKDSKVCSDGKVMFYALEIV